MSHFIKRLLGVLILSFAAYGLSFAQNLYVSNTSKPFVEMENSVTENDKQITGNENINPAAIANFNSLFPNASEVKWSNLKDGSVVSFSQKGQKVMAGFNAKGKINYMVTTLKKEQLPETFLTLIKSDYKTYHFLNAQEVIAHKKTAYYANLENEDGFVTIKHTDDGLEVVQQIEKNK